jgi:hypothetical protein
MERLEQRLKLFEEEQREGAFDITKFYGASDASRPNTQQ